jgi:hypothetical protein
MDWCVVALMAGLLTKLMTFTTSEGYDVFALYPERRLRSNGNDTLAKIS